MKKFWIFFVIILILAAIPRAIELINHNYLFGFDQGQFYIQAKNIIVDHKLTLIGTPVGGVGGFFQGAGWYYLLSIFFLFTGGDPYAGMVLMFCIGMSTVILGAILGKKMFGETTGILISFLLSVSTIIIPQSRFIWPPFPIALLSVLYLYFLYKTLDRKQKYLIFLTFTIGLMFHFETATGMTLLISFVLFFPLLIYKKLVSVKTVILSIGSFMITQFPLLFFDLRHKFLISKGILLAFSGKSHPGHGVTIKYVQAMFENHLNTFFPNFANVFPYVHAFWPFLGIAIIAGGIVYMRDKKNAFALKIFVLYLLCIPFLLFAVFMLYLWPMWDWWILELQIFYLILLSILLIYFYKKYLLFKPIAITVVLLFSASYVSYVVHGYTSDVYDYGGMQKIKGKIEAIDYLYKDAKYKRFNLLIFTPPVYTYAYDYLLWWHGMKTYGFLPKNEKKDTFYLLIETDPAQPWSYKGWLETVIKTGTIEKTVTLPSEFIIQKRTEHVLAQ